MRFGVDIGIDAQTDRRFFAQGQSHLVEYFKFGFTFNVEATNAQLKGLFHLSTCFANARKNNLGRLATCGQHACQFTGRNNVKTATGFGKNLQYSQIGIGFHGVTNLDLATFKAALVGRQGRQHRCFGIGKNRRAHLLGHV